MVTKVNEMGFNIVQFKLTLQHLEIRINLVKMDFNKEKYLNPLKYILNIILLCMKVM